MSGAPARGAIRSCRPSDAARVCDIYNHFVRETVVTFEEAPVAERDMVQRIETTVTRLPWLVWEQDGALAGYACATPWKSRSAYRFAVESTVYVSQAFARQGIGSRLYGALIDELRARDIHCAVGGIALPNPASIALHEKLGFVKIAEFKEIGYKLGRWVDVGYWELLL
ncbi:MAG TPA: arsinothricin resistance N-acetyltransferase ArsN1 family B [Candidatus Polarisedimenticolia bacterium]|nr:arsinothricin resistance N-acetyltransferase ArsN1 family B [Candidatus Polarisedimenticolia bacterium]